jgi:hypothetical protein
MSSSAEQMSGELATCGEAAAGRDGEPASGRQRGTGLATASMVAGIAGFTMVAVIPGLLCGLLGLRLGSPKGQGAVRCWVGIGLSVIWAAAGLYLLPHLIRAADPGCTTYKGPALTAYNRGIVDLEGTSQTVLAGVAAGGGSDKIARDLAHTITVLNLAAAHSRSAAAARDISRLTMQLQTVLADIQNGGVVPDSALASLNRDAAAADAACGTLSM